MQEKHLLKIQFGSFIKLCMTIFFSLGIALGILAFIGSLLGAEIYARLGSLYLTGVKAGLVNIFLFPIIFTVCGFLIGLIAFLPFKIMIEKMKGFKVKIDFK